MDFQFELPQRTLTTEQQAVLDAVNHLFTVLPEQPDSDVAQRLDLMILEVAAVAPQAELALATGFTQDRSVRFYKERLAAQALAALFDRTIPGRRPAISTQPQTLACEIIQIFAVQFRYFVPVFQAIGIRHYHLGGFIYFADSVLSN